jgi:hypothetical protein
MNDNSIYLESSVVSYLANRTSRDQLIEAGVVPFNEQEDALHIALTSLHGFRFLVTWNFSHFVGPEPKLRVMMSLKEWGLNPVLLITPEEYLEGGY